MQLGETSMDEERRRYPTGITMFSSTSTVTGGCRLSWRSRSMKPSKLVRRGLAFSQLEADRAISRHRTTATITPITMARLRGTALLLLLGSLLLVGIVSSADVDLSQDLTEEEREIMSGGGDGDGFGEDGSAEGSGEPVDEKDVVVLGGKNFTEFVAENAFVLVEFYAPWCGHCQSLAPEYARAATVLKESGVKLAKVDATQHAELSQENAVEGYPTLFFFVNGEKRPYSGGRTSDEIVAWAKKKTGPPVRIIKSTAEADEALESAGAIAVAYLESVEGSDVEEFTAVARLEDGVQFYVTADEEIAKKFGLTKKAPALVLLKKQSEKVAHYDGSFEKKAVSVFVSENKLPLVIPFNRETASAIFESDVTKQLLLFASPEEFAKVGPNYEEASKSFKMKITFVLIDLADEEVSSPVLDFFALDNEKTRLLGFVSEEGASKYLYDGDFSVDSIKHFAEKFLDGQLTPFRKSEKAPEENDGPVKIVVSSTFDEIVLDETKDVIFEVYAPWCGHCQSLEPEYNKLGEALSNISSIVIAKMDGTKNEHERLKVEGYPTILFFPAGDKSAEPTPIDTERSAAGFIRFLSANAKIPFVAPEVAEPEPEVAESEEPEEGEEGELEEDDEEHVDEEHVDEEHFDEGHIDEGHVDEGHVDEGHVNEGHVDEGHVNEGHVDEGHVNEGHVDEGHVNDGHVDGGHVEAEAVEEVKDEL